MLAIIPARGGVRRDALNAANPLAACGDRIDTPVNKHAKPVLPKLLTAFEFLVHDLTP